MNVPKACSFAFIQYGGPIRNGAIYDFHDRMWEELEAKRPKKRKYMYFVYCETSCCVNINKNDFMTECGGTGC
jgi:hypothetical protein